VLWIGVLSGGLYAAVAVSQRAIQIDPRHGVLGSVPLRLGVYLVATVGLFALYVVLLSRTHALRTRRMRLIAIGFPLLFNVLFVLVPPSFSIDVLSYVSHGYIRSALDGNPYLTASSAVAATSLGPELASYRWRPVHPVSPYGPVWTHIETGTVSLLGNVRAEILAFKAVAFIFSMGSASLIWLFLGRVRPEYQVVGTLAYLWNPLIVVELAGEGHNEAIVVFFVLLALVLTVQRRWGTAIGAMSVGVLTKYLPLLFAPLQAAYMWRWRRYGSRFALRVVLGVAVGIGLLIALFAPLWAGPETLRGILLTGQPGNTGSTPTLLLALLSRAVPPDLARVVVYLVLIGVLAAYLILQAKLVRDTGDLARACARVSVVYVLFITPSYWPWYAVLPVALLALMPRGGALEVLVALSLGARFVAPLDVMYVQGHVGRPAYLLLTWGFALGPPIVLLTLGRLGGWQRRGAGKEPERVGRLEHLPPER
jgi:hypothetical protein